MIPQLSRELQSGNAGVSPPLSLRRRSWFRRRFTFVCNSCGERVVEWGSGVLPGPPACFAVSNMVGDYAKIAEGLGAVGITVTKTAEMVPALKRAQRLNADGQTVLIDVHSNLESRRSRWDR